MLQTCMKTCRASNAKLAHALVKKRTVSEKTGCSIPLWEGADGAGANSTRQLIADDFAIGATMVEVQLKDKIDAEIQDLVGMGDAKSWLNRRKRRSYVERTGDRTALKTCMNLVLTGNPGGKTSFARLLYRFMRAYGILKSDHEIFVERNGLELKGNSWVRVDPR